jgi:hypothetical protein
MGECYGFTRKWADCPVYKVRSQGEFGVRKNCKKKKSAVVICQAKNENRISFWLEVDFFKNEI